jgi:hypothetical protein
MRRYRRATRTLKYIVMLHVTTLDMLADRSLGQSHMRRRRSINKAALSARRLLRTSFLLVLLLFGLSLRVSATDVDPCPLGILTPAVGPGTRWQEYWDGYKARGQADERSQEEENLLRSGIACVDQRLKALTAIIGKNTELLEARRTELKQLLTDVSKTLSSLTEQVKTLRSIKVDVHTHSDDGTTVARHMVNTLDAQTKVLLNIQNEIGSLNAPSAINVNAFASSSSISAAPRADSTPRDQIDPTDPVQNYYDVTTTVFDFAVVSIPDPRVPRHRRQYDNAISAINQGMLDNGFVLDKFGFPWAKDILPSATGTDKSLEGSFIARLVVNDDHYGLMIFRRDKWRERTTLFSPDYEVEIRALYVVMETGTYGIQQAALASALKKIDSELAVSGHTSDPLELFGPTFSGSMNSIRETILNLSPSGSPNRIASHIASLQLLSPSATVDTNRLLQSSRGLVDRNIAPYSTLARLDTEKLQFIDKLIDELKIEPNKVAVVYESTTFGMEACKSYRSEQTASTICEKGLPLPFPVNIADVRYGLQAKAKTQLQKTETNVRLPMEPTHLSLEEGAENGSEFPESQQSPLTSASTELELQRLIASLQSISAKLVVIIATDVRDRLFLIEQLNRNLDGVLFIDFGADRLLGHPDFIHATRGTLSLSSSTLTTFNPLTSSCRFKSTGGYHVWSTDEQASLGCAIAIWPKGPVTDQTAKPIPYVVSRTGLVSGNDVRQDNWWSTYQVATTAILCFLFAVVALVYSIVQRGKQLREESRELRASVISYLGLAALVVATIWVAVGNPALALLSGVFAFCAIYWSREVSFHWSAAMMWLNTFLLLTIAVFEAVWGLESLMHVHGPLSSLHQLLLALSQSVAGGMAYPIAQAVAGASMIVTVLICRRIAGYTEMDDRVWRLATNPTEARNIRLPPQRTGLVVAALGVTGVTMAAIVFWGLDARQVTVFGRSADFSIFIALVSTTLLAFCLLLGAFGAGARISYICATVKRLLREMHNLDADLPDLKGYEPLMWMDLPGARGEFVATPVMANRITGAVVIRVLAADEMQWGKDLSDLLHISPVDNCGRRALYAILASEMATYQFAILGVAIATIASSSIAYLFPVTRATELISLNLVALLLAGIYSAYKTVDFEGNVVLSNVLCNTSKEKKWSLPFFVCIVIPFVILAVALGIEQIPGVLTAGNGVLDVLFKWAKPGG